MKNDYEIRGDQVVIFLDRKDGTKLETFVSLSDLERLKEFPYKWKANGSRHAKSYYVESRLKVAKRKYRTVQLHRWLLNEPKGLVIDHIDNEPLNNTRENLRAITQSQNLQNRKGADSDNRTGVRGVSWNKRCEKYQVYVVVGGKHHFFGYFDNKKEAEKAAIQARKKLMPFSKENQEVF